MARKTLSGPHRRNPVARHAAKFQRAQTFRDRTRYHRARKHRGRESFSVPTVTVGLH